MNMKNLVLGLAQQMVSTALLPIKIIRHPLDTAASGLQVFQDVGDNLLSHVKARVVLAPSPTAAPSQNPTNFLITAENNNTNRKSSNFLKKSYNFIVDPLKNCLYKNEKSQEKDYRSRIIGLDLVINFIHQWVLFIFAPKTRSRRNDSIEASNQKMLVLDSCQSDTLNKNGRYDNECNHKTENNVNSKKNRVLEATGNEFTSRMAAEGLNPSTRLTAKGESEVVINQGPEIANSTETEDTCSVCGFETRGAKIPVIIERDSFELERVRCKSEIKSLLKEIHNIQEKVGGDYTVSSLECQEKSNTDTKITKKIENDS